MDNVITETDWINHYINKLCEVDQILDSGNTSLLGVKKTLDCDFSSKATESTAQSLQLFSNQILRMREDISETINLLKTTLV